MNKQKLLDHCSACLKKRRQILQNQLKQLQDSLTSETKSSAGDKHETGRAMVQLEQEKLSHQLLELEKSKSILQRVDTLQQTDRVHLGSLVQTDTASYFVAISCDAFQEKGSKVFCISVSAPIAKALLGKKEGEDFTFNGKKHKILKVY